jgi:anti-anti-sigma factor
LHVLSELQIQPLAERRGYRLAGELDLLSAPELGAALADLDSDDGVVLDMAELTFIDSSGCNMLVEFLRGTGHERRIVVLNPSPAVARALDLTGLRLHPNIEIRSGS